MQTIAKGGQGPFFNAAGFSSAMQPWAGNLFEKAMSHAEPLSRHGWHQTMIRQCTGATSACSDALIS
jgi:hypothetical protein